MIFEALIFIVTVLAYWLWRRPVQKQGVDSREEMFKRAGLKEGMKDPPFNLTKLFTGGEFRKNVLDLARSDLEHVQGEKMYWRMFEGKAQLMILDPDMVRQIMVKDFNHFVDREDPNNPLSKSNVKSDKIWANMMTMLGGEEWKELRSTFTPIFTSGKLKTMVPLMSEVSNEIVRAFEEKADKGVTLDLKDMFGRLSLNTIASCVFGVDADTDHAFLHNASTIFKQGPKDILKFMAVILIPGMYTIFSWFNMGLFKPNETSYFYSVLEETLKQRIQSKTRRNDVIDLMLDALKEPEQSQEEGDHDGDQFDRDSKLDYVKVKQKDLEDIQVISTGLVLLVAGYDTTSTTMSYMGYYLAMKPDIQQHLQEEIDQAFHDNGEKFPDHTVILNLEYLDMVLSETLRLYPALGFVKRHCTKEYHLPGTNIFIKEKEGIIINAVGIHMNPDIYPNPSDFNPQHFSVENKANRSPYAYLPFGHGPRACMGIRFAKLEIKLAMVALLRKFNFIRTAETPEKLTLDPASLLAACLDRLIIRVEHRNV